MRIPSSVIERVRGPILAAVVVGCSSAPAPRLAPEPVEVVAAAALTPPESADPVAYDPMLERARLERLNRSDALAETRRARRIEGEAEARRARRFASTPMPGPTAPFPYSTYPDVYSLCGRG